MITRIATVCFILSLWLWIALTVVSTPGEHDPIIQDDGYTKGI